MRYIQTPRKRPRRVLTCTGPPTCTPAVMRTFGRREIDKKSTWNLDLAIINGQLSAKMEDVERAIGDYLAGAPDREGGRAERMAKKLLNQATVSAQPNDPPGDQPTISSQGAERPTSPQQPA